MNHSVKIVRDNVYTVVSQPMQFLLSKIVTK